MIFIPNNKCDKYKDTCIYRCINIGCDPPLGKSRKQPSADRGSLIATQHAHTATEEKSENHFFGALWVDVFNTIFFLDFRH